MLSNDVYMSHMIAPSPLLPSRIDTIVDTFMGCSKVPLPPRWDNFQVLCCINFWYNGAYRVLISPLGSPVEPLSSSSEDLSSEDLSLRPHAVNVDWELAWPPVDQMNQLTEDIQTLKIKTDKLEDGKLNALKSVLFVDFNF